jgi:hypothetical protein
MEIGFATYTAGSLCNMADDTLLYDQTQDTKNNPDEIPLNISYSLFVPRHIYFVMYMWYDPSIIPHVIDSKPHALYKTMQKAEASTK